MMKHRNYKNRKNKKKNKKNRKKIRKKRKIYIPEEYLQKKGRSVERYDLQTII